VFFLVPFLALKWYFFDRQRKAGEKHLYRELEIWEGKTLFQIRKQSNNQKSFKNAS